MANKIIDDRNSAPLHRLSTLCQGDAFEFTRGGILWMVTNRRIDGKFGCVQLSTGYLHDYMPDEKVYPTKIEVHVVDETK